MTLIELVIYIFITSIIGIIVALSINQFNKMVQKNDQINVFSKNYNSFLKRVYSNGFDGRVITGSNLGTTGIVLENSGNVMAYSCAKDGIYTTYDFTGIDSIDFVNYNMAYTGFVCQSLTGWTAGGGYWLGVELTVLGKDTTLNYYINNK